MPYVKAIHWNVPETPGYRYLKGKARCGRKLSAVEWSTDLAKVNCRACHDLGFRDKTRDE